jgi:alpha-methylacyl-CoA racemase
MQTANKAQGPLRGVKVAEFVGLGPAPFCAMLLSDLGADVIRIDRPGAFGGGPEEVLARGRRSIGVNLKADGAIEACSKILQSADILLEGYRPGVMERLGLGPDVCLKANPKLVYGRMTGWGQHGPLAHAAGHDLNYIALTGALDGIGPKERPGAAAQRGRRFRRRLALSRRRRARGAPPRAGRPGRARWSTRPLSTARPI